MRRHTGIEGIKPFAISLATGFAKAISIKKEMDMINTSATINASIFRMPNFCKYSNKKVSSTVMLTPHTNGRPKPILSGILDWAFTVHLW